MVRVPAAAARRKHRAGCSSGIRGKRQTSGRPPALSRGALIVALVAGVLAAPVHAAGTIGLTSETSYLEDFDTLAVSGTANSVLPVGWALAESGSSTRNNAAYAASTGSDNAGDVYSFGSAGSTERAYGTLRSASLVPLVGATFANNTGAAITSLTVSYTGEQWRAGVTNRGAADRLDFQLSTDAASLTSGTWTGHNDLDLNSPNTSAPTTTLDGNNAANRVALTHTITGLAIPNGATFWLRWVDFDIPGADDGLAIDDFSLTAGAADAGPAVTNTFPSNGSPEFPKGANLSVTFSEPVGVSGAWFRLACSISGTVVATYSEGPTTFTLDPASDLVHGESCVLTVLANAVTDQDINDPPDTMTSDFFLSFSPFDVCEASYTPIPSIQGSGSAAAVTGNVTTRGVVVGDFEGSSGLQGFYMQDPVGDGDVATSDGIFVFTGNSSVVSEGQLVRVTAFARERFGQTTLNGSNSNSSAVPAANIVECGTGSTAPTDVTMPFASSEFPERFEGMLVRLPQALVISEYFNYDRFGEIVLALPLPGEARPFTPTSIVEPGEPALERAEANRLRRITLDDGLGIQNPSFVRHPGGGTFALNNGFRGGDTVRNTVGVLGFDFGLYRIQPTAPTDYTAVNHRPIAPGPVGGNVRAAAFNTLNFFLTLDRPTGDPLDNRCGPSQNLECRGADSDQPLEFTRQRDKLLAALTGLDADIVGLNELENTPGVDPLGDPEQGLVSGLNSILGSGTYAALDTDIIGTDAIRVGLMYKPSVVRPVGDFELLTSAVDPRFLDTKSRPALAQTFEVLSNGARFTVVVTHLKSKGSDCNDLGDPDAGDGQGNCNQTRTRAAEALVDWLATDPTGSGDPDFLILGDLNSYAQEDPIDAIEAGSDDIAGTGDDLENLIERYVGTFAYSFTFDGQAGYLDHALASATLADQATGATEWHINADEPDLLDYDTSFKPPSQDALYQPNAYRSSDHDPLLVGLAPASEATALQVTSSFYDDNGAPTQLSATLRGQACNVAGRSIEFYVDLDGDGQFSDAPDEHVGSTPTDASGVAILTWESKSVPAWSPGIWEVKAAFDGGPNCLPSEDATSVAIVQPGDAANGGGWYQFRTTASPRVNFAFTVRREQDGTYRGRLLWHNNEKWRIKGNLTSFGTVDPCTYGGTPDLNCGSSAGIGKLFRWNGSMSSWDHVQDVNFVVSFVDGASSKKGGARPDYFGINVTDFSDPTLPESSPQQLKGGNVHLP